MKSQVKKRFDLKVEAANAVVSKTFELDKNITVVKGMLVTSDRDDLLYTRGSQKIEINKQEYFPENYESKLLMSGINVSPNQRYYDLGSIAISNSSIKVDFKDTGADPFTAYRVSFYFDCELD